MPKSGSGQRQKFHAFALGPTANDPLVQGKPKRDRGGMGPGQSHMARREGYASLAPSARSRFPPQKLCQYFPDGIILRWNYSSAIALGMGPFGESGLTQGASRIERMQD